LYDKDFRKKIFPPDPITKDYIIISKLKPGEVLNVKFTASKNIAMTHARWSPVSVCTYFNQLDKKVVTQNAKIAEDKNRFETIDKYRHFIINKYGEPSSFNFTIESECRLTPHYIFKTAINVLSNKILGLEKKMKVEEISKEHNMFAIMVSNEDHTIGNLVQVYIYNNHVRTDDAKVDFIGYFQPHPLENNIVFKIKFFKDIDPATFMTRAFRSIADELATMDMKWTEILNKKK
jgi:DNA-directed RNA polymerase subunit L